MAKEKKSKRFKLVSHQDLTTFQIFVDTETRVQYIVYTSIGSGLTVLVDPNGKPLLYDGEL